MTIYCLRVGAEVRLRNGMVATIKAVDVVSDQLFPIEGTATTPDGFTRTMSWTNAGHYYIDGIEDGRDIEEVVSGQRVEITRAHGVHDYLGAGENTNRILLYGSQTN